MIARVRGLISFAAVVALLAAGCRRFPGQPEGSADAGAARGSSAFTIIYAQNCAGCHGTDGKGGPALALANPIYLALVPDASMQRTIATGVHGTMMPAFSIANGGILTDAEINVMVRGLKETWGQSGLGVVSEAPPYSSQLTGNVQRGARSFTASCARCHGDSGEGGRRAGAVVDDSFLALVSDQGLRTTILAGRPDLGHPDWRGEGGIKPLTDQELTDIVAWLTSKRVTAPGRPYPAPKG